MILVCELLTEEPEGGSAMIPLEVFVDIYRFLANIDASKGQLLRNIYFTDEVLGLVKKKEAAAKTDVEERVPSTETVQRLVRKRISRKRFQLLKIYKRRKRFLTFGSTRFIRNILRILRNFGNGRSFVSVYQAYIQIINFCSLPFEETVEEAKEVRRDESRGTISCPDIASDQFRTSDAEQLDDIYDTDIMR